jgi:hypothetical protein
MDDQKQISLQETSYQLNLVPDGASLLKVNGHQIAAQYFLDPEKTHLEEVGGTERFEVPKVSPCHISAKNLNEEVTSRLEELVSNGTANAPLLKEINEGSDDQGNSIVYADIQFYNLRFIGDYLPEGLDKLPEQLS